MTTTTERTETDLRARLAALDTMPGTTDPALLLEERDAILRALVELRRMADDAAAADYRAANEAKSVQYRARLTPCVATIGDLVPRLLDALQELARLELESYDVPNPGFDAIGIPYGFASKVLAAIQTAAPDTAWDQNNPPRLKPKRTYALAGIRPTDFRGNPVDGSHRYL